MHEFESKNIKVDDINVYYRQGGKAKNPNLVWLDGLSISKNLEGRLEKTGNFLLYFSDSFKIYSIEYPAFMRSDIPKTEWNIDNYTDLLHNVFDELQVEKPFVLMGHSFGAMLSLMYSQKFPTDINLLAISAPPITYEYSPFQKKIFRLLEKTISTIYKSNTIPENVKKMIPEYFMSTSNRNLKRYSPKEFRVGIETFRKMATTNYLPFIENHNVKTIFIAGSKDFLVPMANTLRVVEKLGNTDLHVFNEGHTTLPYRMYEFKDIMLDVSLNK